MARFSIVATSSIRAYCQICEQRILTKKHIHDRTGNYHVSCFQNENREVLTEILALAGDEVDVRLVARANERAKFAWHLDRNGNKFTIHGPKSFWQQNIALDRKGKPIDRNFVKIELDSELMVEGALLGEKYFATFLDQEQLDKLNMSGDIYGYHRIHLVKFKVTPVGFQVLNKWNSTSNMDDKINKIIYLVEGIKE